MTRLAAALFAVLALLLAGCSGSPDESESDDPSNSAESSEPDVPRPEVGECRQLKPKDIPPRSNRTDPVDCSKPHTALTVKVIDLPKRITRDTPDKKLLKLSQKCAPAVEKAYGGTKEQRGLTMLSWAWFMPTKAEEEAGARWIRCDATVGAQSELPKSTPFLSGEIPESLRACFTRGASEMVPCTEPHYYRSNVTVEEPVSGPYPSKAELNAIGSSSCSAQAAGQPYAWNYPSEGEWKKPGKDGSVTITCFRVDAGAST